MNTRLKDRIDEVTEKLDALRRQREGVDRQIELLAAQLEAYQEAGVLLNDNEVPPVKPAEPSPVRRRPRRRHASAPVSFQARLIDVIAAIKKSKSRFTTDDVVAALAARGSTVSRPQVRGRLADLVTNDVLIRISGGLFEFPADKAA